jgi:L-cystine uptake protein TcyP (sodium:dicarboxylate symporter family)
MIGLMIGCLFGLAIAAFYIACGWKVYTKAGQPGWACLIPIYNTYIWLKIVGRPVWWLLLMFIPLVNIIIAIILVIDLAKSFGQGVGFALGLIFLGFIFYPILAFGASTYSGPSVAAA